MEGETASNENAAENSKKAVSIDWKKIHIVSIIFHFLFKFLALFLYLFGNYVLSFVLCSSSDDDSGTCGPGFVISFILVSIVNAMDFWVTKNVTGRMLAGLRWWHVVRENGENEWRFERAKDSSKHNLWEKLLFWLSFPLFLFLWVALLLLSVLVSFSFSYALICVVSMIILSVNVVGYLLCLRGAVNKEEVRQQASEYASGVATGIITEVVTKEVTKRTFGSYGGGAGENEAGAKK